MQIWNFSKHPVFKYDFWEITWYLNMNFWCFLFTPECGIMKERRGVSIIWLVVTNQLLQCTIAHRCMYYIPACKYQGPLYEVK